MNINWPLSIALGVVGLALLFGPALVRWFRRRRRGR